jgi:hypothetical protein
MSRARLAVGACVIALASCGGEASAPGPESEPREEQQERPARADTGTGPRGAPLDALCEEVVRETGISLRIPPRRAGEAYPAYSRRLGRATAGIARVYRILHGQLKDLPATRQDVLFQSYLSAADLTARQFEDIVGGGFVLRNRIELRAALFYPMRTYRDLAAPGAMALEAPSCAPRPRRLTR